MSLVEEAAAGAMRGKAIHEQWVSTYRTPEAQQFYEMAFDEVARRLGAPAGSTILDAGCGSCAKSILLARRGFHVVGADFSETALALAAETLVREGLLDRITLKREDLLRLSFPSGTFRYAVCWGVLMHIPDLPSALRELARVLEPGGRLVVSEGNVHSLQSVLLRAAKRVFGRRRSRVTRVAAGLETVEETPQGILLTRQTDFRWFAAACADYGLTLEARFAGQFTELYVLASSALLRRWIHAFNRLWFLRIGWAAPAFGNILVLRKAQTPQARA